MFSLDNDLYVVDVKKDDSFKTFIMSKKELKKFLKTNSNIVYIHTFTINRGKQIDSLEFEDTKNIQLKLL